jgi:hypothetical protein
MPPELALPFLTASMVVLAIVSAWVVFRDTPPEPLEGEPLEPEEAPHGRWGRP